MTLKRMWPKNKRSDGTASILESMATPNPLCVALGPTATLCDLMTSDPVIRGSRYHVRNTWAKGILSTWAWEPKLELVTRNLKSEASRYLGFGIQARPGDEQHRK